MGTARRDAGRGACHERPVGQVPAGFFFVGPARPECSVYAAFTDDWLEPHTTARNRGGNAACG